MYVGILFQMFLILTCLTDPLWFLSIYVASLVANSTIKIAEITPIDTFGTIINIVLIGKSRALIMSINACLITVES